MTLSLNDLRALPHLSVSQIKTFVQCPKKYALQYIERHAPAFRPMAFAFGTAFHEAAAVHLSVDTTPEQLAALFRDSVTRAADADGPPLLFDDDEADLGATIDLGLRMLDAFVTKVPRPAEVLGVEVPFALELAHPVTGEIAPVPLIGAMDALVVDRGGVRIWEIKTSKKKWSADQIEFDAQSTAYVMATRTLGYDDASATLLVATKTKTPDVQIVDVVRHRRDESELVETALTVLRATEAGIDHRIRNWACKTCPYADACSA